MSTQQAQKFRLLGCQLSHLVTDHQHLFLGVECEFTNAVHCHFLTFLSTYTAQDSLNTEHEFLHGERLGYIIVGTDLESLKDILLDRLGSQENDRHFSINSTDFLCKSETILLRHHHVEHT